MRLLLAIILSGLISCAAREELPRLPPDAVVLAFGDSITYGTGAGQDDSYPAVLARLIGRKVINAGVPGEISAEGATRLAELLESEHPALLILCHGGNDMLRHLDKQETATNLRRMINLAKEHGCAVLLMAVPAPDLSLAPPSFYRELATASHIPVDCKTLPRILSKGSLKSDYIHPNAAGYKALAEALAKLLARYGAL